MTVNKELLNRCWHLGIYYGNWLHPPLIWLTRQYCTQITASITAFPNNFRESVRANLIERKWSERLLLGSAIEPEPGHWSAPSYCVWFQHQGRTFPWGWPYSHSHTRSRQETPWSQELCSAGRHLAGILQTLCGEEDFLPLYHNQGKKNVRKLLGHSRSPSECDFRHWHLASSLHASSVADHLNTKVTCEDNTERGGI